MTNENQNQSKDEFTGNPKDEFAGTAMAGGAHQGREQGANKPADHLTTLFGAPVGDRENSATAGPRGPMVMQDPYFLEQMGHFDREVIPERRMHAKGSGAYGTFTVTNDITEYTKAKIFSEVGKQTEIGRASCRERGWSLRVDGWVKKKETRVIEMKE